MQHVINQTWRTMPIDDLKNIILPISTHREASLQIPNFRIIILKNKKRDLEIGKGISLSFVGISELRTAHRHHP